MRLHWRPRMAKNLFFLKASLLGRRRIFCFATRQMRDFINLTYHYYKRNLVKSINEFITKNDSTYLLCFSLCSEKCLDTSFCLSPTKGPFTHYPLSISIFKYLSPASRSLTQIFIKRRHRLAANASIRHDGKISRAHRAPNISRQRRRTHCLSTSLKSKFVTSEERG